MRGLAARALAVALSWVSAWAVLPAQELPTVSLMLRDGTLEEMQRCLRQGDPAQGHADTGNKPYFKAFLLGDGGQAKGCKVCLRGAMAWHHDPQKPSLRVKLDKADWLGGDRFVELTRPEDALAMVNWLPLQFARDLDLMTDGTHHVRVFLDRRDYGVYLRSSRPGEALALAHRRMPGTFFKGDFGGNLWAAADVWNRFGEDDAADRATFDTFLGLLRLRPTAAVLQHLETVLDVERYARWSALMVVTGSTHTDAAHNQVFFFSAVHGKIEPLPWDCNSYGVHTVPHTPVDTLQHPVSVALLSDPRFVHRRNQWIQRLLTEIAPHARVAESVHAAYARLEPWLAREAQLGDVRWNDGEWRWQPLQVPLSCSRDALLAWNAARYAFLARYLDDARVVLEPLDGARTRVHVHGTVGVQARDAASAPTPGSDRVLLPGLGCDLHQFANSEHPQAIGVSFLRPAPLSYELAVPTERLLLSNAITGGPVQVESSLPSTAPACSIHPDAFAAAPLEDVDLGPGEVTLAADLVVAPTRVLRIRPGTTVRLRAGVGIYSEGRVLAEGTAEAPIHLSAADAAPWAAFAIAGPATAGSVLAHVHVADGSVGRLYQRRFKGMVDAYESPQVRFFACVFGRNQVGDDAVNLALSGVDVEACSFAGARADALDLDMCHGTVRDCQFADAGNDGLDLMESQVTVDRCAFLRCGDKGLSVGEGTQVVVRDSEFLDNVTGAELKDASCAWFERCRLRGNQTAVRAYQKKAIYDGGGRGLLVDCELRDSRVADVVLEPGAAATLVRSAARFDDAGGQLLRATDVPVSWAAWRAKQAR